MGKYTKGMEDIERTFEHLDARERQARRREWLEAQKKGAEPTNSSGKDMLSSKEGNTPTKKEE